MARKRMIDPTIWEDEDFGSLSPEAALLFISMFSHADDEGRLPANPSYLISLTFPFKTITKERSLNLRDEVLSKMASLVLYEIDKKEYLQFSKWDSYQSINRPTTSKYPTLTEDSRRTHGGLTPNRIEQNRIEEKRREEKNATNFLENLTSETIEELSGKFGISTETIQEEKEKARDWLRQSGKTMKDYRAFFNNWLRRYKEDKKTPTRKVVRIR